MLRLYLEAPFAAFRTFTAGWYRPTAPFLTPSAAYGLLLNLAGIESRLWEHDPQHDGKVPASLSRSDLPRCRLALGSLQPQPPRVQTVFQQLHNYPVGRDAGVAEELAKGNKNNITPVRREYLSDLRAVIWAEGEGDLEDRIRRGLRGEFNASRYGLPFVGDNAFLVDRLEEIDASRPVYWYRRLVGASGDPRPGAGRLTIWIDRADMSRTTSMLLAPDEVAADEPPEGAWIDIRSPQSSSVRPKPGRAASSP